MNGVDALLASTSRLANHATNEAKRLKQQKDGKNGKKANGRPRTAPTPAELLAAVTAALADLTTAVGNQQAAAANVNDALAAEALAEANVVTAKGAYDAAVVAYLASTLPPPE